MSCKECIHENVCKIRHFPSLYGVTGYGCVSFKDKTNLLEIPDTVIIHTKDKWLVLNMESEHLGGAIKSVIDYCTPMRGE